MTEQEWLDCSDPTPMLLVVEPAASDRKLRLFAVAFARSFLNCHSELEKAVDIGERFADGLASDEERQQGARELDGIYPSFQQPEALSAYYAARWTVSRFTSCKFIGRPTWQVATRATGEKQPVWLREVFGNPFRSAPIEGRWRPPTVVGLAQCIYDQKSFHRMPELADALQRAGCDNEDILCHCRNGSPHVRGCWALDLLLGKA